jgi:CHAT domain-containing protein/Flp pilus assembly protein TadD
MFFYRFALAITLLCAVAHLASAQAPTTATVTSTIIRNSISLCVDDKYVEAQKLLEEQLAKTKAKPEREKLQNALADVHGWWAQALEKNYDFQGAIAHYLKAYETNKILRRYNAALDLNDIAKAHFNLSRYDEALRYWNQSLPIRREVKDREGEAFTLGNIGLAYFELSRYEDALRHYEQALTINQEVKDRQGEAVTLRNIGGVYDDLSRYEEALRYYGQALNIFLELKDRSNEAITLNNTGLVHGNLKRYDDALRCYEQALPIYREFADRHGEGGVLNNIGLAYQNLGRHEEALRYYEQVLPISREVKSRQGEATTLNNIGLAYLSLNRYEEALRYYRQALPILREIKDRRVEAITLYALMWVHSAQNQPALAIVFGKQAVNLYQAMRRDMRGLDKTSRDAFLKGNEHNYQNLARLLIGEGRFAEAEEVLAMVQQEEFLEFVRRDSRGAALTDINADWVGQEKSVMAEQDAKIESLARLSSEEWQLSGEENLSEAQKARLEQVRQALEAAQKQLETFFAAMPERFKRNADDVQKDKNQLSALVPLLRSMGEKSGSKVALISAFVDDKGLELLVTLPTGQTVNLSFAADEKQLQGETFPVWLNTQIYRFKVLMLKRRPSVNEAAARLWDIVGCQGQLATQLEGAGITTVMWRLTGPLRALPLAALRDKDGFLVEKYRNVVLTAGSSELNLAHQPVTNWKALGLGVTKPWKIENDEFSALPSVEGELSAVMNAPGDGYKGGVLPGRVLRDEKFSAEGFFKAMRGATPESNAPWQVVHIASHFKLAGDSLKSFLLTGDGKALTIAALQERGAKNPLFPGVELMTLSACDTASGEGKGADSLGALAELNGAKSVLATLWPVADEETAQLMADFYRTMAQNPAGGKAAALQSAQLKLLKAGGESAHPYFWAPFVLMGNWR